MRRFDNTGLWRLLQTSGSSATTLTAGFDTILDEFVTELHEYCREEKDIAEKTRSLNYAKAELSDHLEFNRYESKKYTCLRILIKRSIYFIDGELCLIKLDLEHPERFIVFPEDCPTLARWNGNINDLIEYFVGPQASGKLLNPDGRPMNYEESIGLLEKIFGIKIPNPADRRGRVLDRQKNTSFQDEMRRIFLEEAEKRNK
nr:MAG TPA: RteC protein [Caudoviricetes sp.]